MQFVPREVIHNQSQVQELNLAQFELSQVSVFIMDDRQVSLPGFYHVSDLSKRTWSEFHKEQERVVADLRLCSRLYAFQYLNLLYFLKSRQIVILVNDLIVEQILNLLNKQNIKYNLYDIAQSARVIDTEFKSPLNKISEVLKQIESSDSNVLVYCESLHQMDQIFQALHYNEVLSGSQQYDVHLHLPSEPFYAKSLKQLSELALPKSRDRKKQIHLARHYLDAKSAQIDVSFIIQMGYLREIITFDEQLQVIVYRIQKQSRTDLLLKNRVTQHPKVLFLFSQDEFLDLPLSELFNEEELLFNREVLYLRQQQYHVQLIQANYEFDEQAHTSNIPIPYQKPLFEAVDETLNHYTHIISTLLTEGEILSEGILETRLNPLRSCGIQQSRESIIRTSLYWSSLGDCTSWVQLINKFVVLLEDVLLQTSELGNNEHETLRLHLQNDLINWCRKLHVCLPKMLVVLAYNEYLLQQIGQTEHSLLYKYQLDLQLNRTLSLKKQGSMPEHCEEIQIYLLRQFYRGLCVFTGHRSSGYKSYVTSDTYRLTQNNLMTIIGDYPLTCIILAMNLNLQGQLEIKYQNKVNDVVIGSVAPKDFVKEYKLQFIQRQSLQMRECIVPGVGQVLFNELWKTPDGPIVSQKCLIERNVDLNLIQVHYDPNVADEQIILKELNEQINVIKQKLKKQVREVPYENDTKFIMESGGIMRDWIDKSAYKTFFIEGLPLEVTPEDLSDFLQESDVGVTEIRLNKVGDNVNARVSVSDHEDVEWCIENISEYRDKPIRIYAQHDQFEHIEQNIRFKQEFQVIFEWQIHLNRNITFPENELTQYELNGTTYQITKSDKISSCLVDQYATLEEIEKALGFADFKLEKKFRYENQNQDLRQQIVSLLHPFNGKYTIASIEKVFSNRVVTLNIQNIDDVDSFKVLDTQVKQIMGLPVKIRVKTKYIHEYHGSIEMKQIIHSILKAYNYQLTVDTETQVIEAKVIGNSKEEHLKISKELEEAINGRKLELKEDLSCFFNAHGLKQLKLWEQQFQVLFRIDYVGVQVFVHCSNAQFVLIVKEIEQMFHETVKIVIQIPKHAQKVVMGDDSNGLQQIKKSFGLTSVRFNYISRELYLQGKQENLDQACSALQETISQQQTNTVDVVTCGYCCDQMKNGYLLQECGHKFCLQCIMFSVQNCLGDMSALPIRCPLCNIPILLADLYILLDEVNWAKLIKISINKYIGDHNTEIGFCITPNCPIIFYNKIPRYNCFKCQKTYCNNCRVLYHYGQTCREYKAGAEDSINIYMKKFDIRKCPHCKSLIQRIDGCYRVTCTGCKKSICWKNITGTETPCMLVFETASQCYDHLTKEHGGYW